MASQKMLAPKTSVWWVPKAGVTNYHAMTATQVNAGVNISCAIVTGYTLNSTDSDTDDSRSICDSANVSTPTYENYEANITFFRDDDDANATSVYNQAYALFAAVDAEGYLVRRIGKDAGAVAAVGDEVSIFGVTSDYMQSVDGSDDGAPAQFTVPFLPTGEMELNLALA